MCTRISHSAWPSLTSIAIEEEDAAQIDMQRLYCHVALVCWSLNAFTNLAQQLYTGLL